MSAFAQASLYIEAERHQVYCATDQKMLEPLHAKAQGCRDAELEGARKALQKKTLFTFGA